MAVQNQRTTPLSPSPSSLPSPALSGARSFFPSSGTLGSYPVTTASFTSSPEFLDTHLSSESPNLFEDLEYSSDMDDDFLRIDQQAAMAHDTHSSPFSSRNEVLVPSTPPPMEDKTWVVFCGRLPGVYDTAYVYPSTRVPSVLT